jgi:hypothetical protein
MGEECSKCLKHLNQNLRGRYHIGDLDIEGDNIKMDLRVLGCVDEDRIHLTHRINLRNPCNSWTSRVSQEGICTIESVCTHLFETFVVNC